MIQMRGNNVGVEKLGKTEKGNGFLSMPEDTNSAGILKYVGKDVKDPDLKVGRKVYFGSQRQSVNIDGVEIMVMHEDNVVAFADAEGRVDVKNVEKVAQ